MLTRKYLFSALCVVLLGASSIVAGCGEDTVRTVTTGVTCGTGTEAIDGQCLPAGTPIVCGDGTVLSGDGAMCVPDTAGNNGEVTTCGNGTVLQGTECVVDPNAPELTCGAGTAEDNGACIPNCGPGTVLQGTECVLEADPVVCGAGTTLENGTCVADTTAPPCGAGTMFDGTECLPVDPFADITAFEGAEPNDTVVTQRSGVATEVTLGAEGEIQRIGGTIDAPSVVQADGAEFLVADFDTYTIVLNKGTRIHMETWGIGVPQTAAFVEYVPADDEVDPLVFQRLMVSYNDRNASREFIAPVSGTYAITIGFQTDLLDAFGLTNPFFGAFGAPAGGETFTYILGLGAVANPTPASENSTAFTWDGDLAEIPQLLLDAPAGTLVDINFESNGANTNGLYWLSTVDYGERLGQFASGRHIVPAGGLLITADHFWIAGPDSTFSMTGLQHVPQDGGTVAGGTTIHVADEDLGLGGESNWIVDVTEPIVLKGETAAGLDSFAQPVLVVRDDGYNVLAVSNLDGDARGLAVALAEPGRYYLQLIENSGLLGDGVTYTADLDVEALPLWTLGDDPVLTTTHTSTTITESITAGAEGFFRLDVTALGNLLVESTASTAVGLDLQLFTTPQLGDGFGYQPDFEADNAGGTATIEALLGGELFVRVAHDGAASSDLTVSASLDAIEWVEEVEPNQNIGEPTDLGTLTEAPTFGRGTLTLGAQPAVLDTWSFTVSVPSIVNVVTFPQPGNNPDTTLTILNAGQDELGFNDDSGSLQSSVTVILQPGEYYAVVDGFAGAEEGPYSIAAAAVALDNVADFGVGDAADWAGVALGYDEGFNPRSLLFSVQVTEPMVARIAVDTGLTDSDPIIAVANGDLEIVAQTSGAGERSLTVAFTRTGQYYLYFLENSFFASPGPVEAVDITIESIAALPRLGNGPLTTTNPTATATNTTLGDAGAEAYYWVEIGEYGDASLMATPQANLDVELQVFGGPQLARDDIFEFLDAVNADGAGGVETLGGSTSGVWIIRAVNVGATAAAMRDLTLAASLTPLTGIVDESEPNDDISLANPLGAVNNATTLRARGRIEPGAPDEFGFAGPSEDNYRFTLDTLSEVTVTVTGIDGAGPFDIAILDRGQNAQGSTFGAELRAVLEPGTWFVRLDAERPGDYILEVSARSLACFPGRQMCAGANVQLCNADGTALDVFACGLGCAEDGGVAGCIAQDEVEPNNTRDVADDQGTLALDSLYAIEGAIDSTSTDRDDDWYSFTLDADAVVTAETRASSLNPVNFDSEMWLYDSTDMQLANDDDGGEGLFSKIGPQFLQAGTYFIRVEYYSTFTNGAGPYRLEILIDTPLCTFGAATCDGDNLSVCNGLEFAAEATCANGCTDSGAGDATCNLPMATPIGIRPWTSNPSAVSVDSPTQWFSIEVTDPRVVTFTFGSAGAADFDGRAFLCAEDALRADNCAYGLGGGNLAYDDDGAGNLYPEITITLDAPGTYYLAIEDWNGAAGDFILNVTEELPPMPDGDDDPATANVVPYAEITPPQVFSVDAEIGVLGDQDWYVFTLPVSMSIGASVVSNVAQLDMRMTLCDEAQVLAGLCGYDGDNIVTGDQGFEGETDSLAAGPLAPGTYFILVESWDSFISGAVGDYRLSIGEP